MTSIEFHRASDERRRWRQIRRTLFIALPLALAVLTGCRDADTVTAPAPTPRASALISSVPGIVTQLTASAAHACALRNDGVVECWGAIGPIAPIRSATKGGYTQVGTGEHHACALRDDGVVECWGGSSFGSAPATRSAASGHFFTQLGVGLDQTCALREDGVIECWGRNDSGQAPATKSTAASGHVFTQVSPGYTHTCALRDDGVVECWGSNANGQAPTTKSAVTGVFAQVSAGIHYTCALRDDGVVECWGNDSAGQAPTTRAPLSGKFSQVFTMYQHTCATRDTGAVECWGSNSDGQAPATRSAQDNHTFTEVAVNITASCALRDDGLVECWGNNDYGQAPPIKMAGNAHLRPTASFGATPTVIAGTAFTLALANAQVPGHPEATSFTYAFDCGDGSGYGAFAATSTATCSTSTVGTRAVKGTVRDQDNDATEYAATVQITPPDNTPPVITPTVSGTLGTNGWYTGDVTVTWSVTDAESTVSAQAGCGPTTIALDTPGRTITCDATSAGGSNSQQVAIKRDATRPTLAPAVSPSPVMLNTAASAAPNAYDGLSGVASATCPALNTASVGAKSVTCAVMDNAGNQTTASAAYTVTYQFGAFSSPIVGNGILNVAKAGQTIPLKWRLLDAAGHPITTATAATVTVATLSCALGASTDAVEEYTSGASGLQNLGDGYYQYNWKTPKDYAGSCKTMQLDLGEGLTHTALFQFTK